MTLGVLQLVFWKWLLPERQKMLCLSKKTLQVILKRFFFCFVLFLFCFCFCFLSTIRKNHNLILYGSFHFMENEEFQVNSSLNNEIQPQTVPWRNLCDFLNKTKISVMCWVSSGTEWFSIRKLYFSIVTKHYGFILHYSVYI